MKASGFLDHIRRAKAKHTYAEYKAGLSKFVEWYGKDLETILAERKQDLAGEEPIRGKRFNRAGSSLFLCQFKISCLSYFAEKLCKHRSCALNNAITENLKLSKAKVN